jgi:nucleoside phosphorylase
MGVGHGSDRRNGLECEPVGGFEDIGGMSCEEVRTPMRARVETVWSALNASLRREARLRMVLKSYCASLTGLLVARGDAMPELRRSGVEQPLDALIVTALQSERRAVRSHLSDVCSRHIGAVTADIGTFDTGSDGSGGRAVQIGVIEVGPGNIDAATHTTQAVMCLRPSMVLVVGVAGGIKDVAIGDVVVSNKIYWSESGRSEAELDITWPDFGPVSLELVQCARAVASRDEWQSRFFSSEPEAAAPRAWVAPIAVGERVIASSRSAGARRIRRPCSDALAVAMEDVGVSRATELAGVRSLSIRGISDLLDGKEAADAAGGQPVAAAHAAAFAFELLSELQRK